MAVQFSVCVALSALLCVVHGKPLRLSLDPEVNYSAVSGLILCLLRRYCTAGASYLIYLSVYFVKIDMQIIIRYSHLV